MNRKKGLVIVYTGGGKGKTTAALGLVLRASGWGKKILIIQFIKQVKTGEYYSIEKYLKNNIKIKIMGEGFFGILGDKKEKVVHQASAKKALLFAKKEIMSKKYSIIILDEILGAIKGRLLKLQDVLEILKSKPDEVTLVLTGRDAPSQIIKQADLVTEMTKIKHPYDDGLLAQKGVDY